MNKKNKTLIKQMNKKRNQLNKNQKKILKNCKIYNKAEVVTEEAICSFLCMCYVKFSFLNHQITSIINC